MDYDSSDQFFWQPRRFSSATARYFPSRSSSDSSDSEEEVDSIESIRLRNLMRSSSQGSSSDAQVFTVGNIRTSLPPSIRTERLEDAVVTVGNIRTSLPSTVSTQRLEDALAEFALNKSKPASKASIAAMPKVLILEADLDKACPVCLADWEIGGEAIRMPCMHKYHDDCIENWLKRHGTCPVCRFKVPDEEDERRGFYIGTVWIDHRSGPFHRL